MKKALAKKIVSVLSGYGGIDPLTDRAISPYIAERITGEIKVLSA